MQGLEDLSYPKLPHKLNLLQPLLSCSWYLTPLTEIHNLIDVIIFDIYLSNLGIWLKKNDYKNKIGQEFLKHKTKLYDQTWPNHERNIVIVSTSWKKV